MVDKHDMKLEFPCNQCGKVLPSELILKHHKMEQHAFNPFKNDGEELLNQQVVSVIKAFKCDICGKRLKSSRTLDMHKKQEHKTVPHNYRCNKCDYTSYEKGKLKNHTDEVHKKEPTKCNLCEEYFESFSKCRAHKDAVHYNKTSLICTVCKKDCGNIQRDLAEHMLDQHQIIYKYM